MEGILDEAVLRRLLNESGLTPRRIQVKGGRPALLASLGGINRSAQWARWVVLIDLDGSFPCAPAAVREWLPNSSAGMTLRIATHAVEGWLMADRDGLSRFLRLPQHALPAQPDALPQPKSRLLEAVRHSHSNQIRTDFLPQRGAGARVGPGYNPLLASFARLEWDLDAARLLSPSLDRTLTRLRALSMEMRP